MVKRSFMVALFLLAASNAWACYDPAGSGQCGPNGIGPRNPSGYGDSGGGGSYYDPSRVPLPPIVITLPDRFGAIAEEDGAHVFSVTNKDSMEEAKRDVVRKCKRETKSSSCRAVFAYGNGCVAAVSGKLLDGRFLLFPESAPTANEANRKAMKKCKKSAKDCIFIVQNECSIEQPPR